MTERPIVDFDHHSPRFAATNRQTLRDLQEQCPVAWTEAHGGYWVVSDYQGVAAVSRDDDRFASGKDGPDGLRRGTSIPESPGLAIPIETDPPEFYTYRRLLNPWFTPAAVERNEPMIRRIAHSLVDRFIERGRCDLVFDLANPLPAIVTMRLLGLPLADWERYATAMHKVLYTPQGTAEFAEVSREYQQLAGGIFVTLAERRAEPADDLLSFLGTTEVDGQPLSDMTISNIVNLVIAGGVDTTTALTANALIHLYRHPDDRERLRAEPDARALATEEFLRYFSPIQALARTVTVDTELEGHRMKAGERVLVCWAGANQDPAMFDRPDEVVLDRFPNRHTSFGLGLHRCVGSNLARAEFRVMLDVVLERLPDYQVDEDALEPYPSLGIVNGWISAPATFTPGPSVGAERLGW